MTAASNGGYTMLQAAIAKVHWGNCGHKMRRYPHAMMRVFQRSAPGVVLSRVVSWPRTKPRARKLDDLQLYWLCRAHGARRAPGVSQAAAWARARTVAQHQQIIDGKWGEAWIKRQYGYWEHALRHPWCWAATLGQATTAQHLRTSRAKYACGSPRGQSFHAGAGRTKARAPASRCVQRRWIEGLDDVRQEVEKQTYGAGTTAQIHFQARGLLQEYAQGAEG